MLGRRSGKRPADLVAPRVIGAGDFMIQMASIVKESTLGHSKHRIHRLSRSWSSVLKMRCACQMEGPNIIYRVAPRDLGTPSRHSREGSFHLVSARSTNGRYSVPVLMTACTTRAILEIGRASGRER